MRLPTVVFDFDGTLALGRGPVLAYARHVAGVTGDEGFLPAALAALDRLDAGEAGYLDGYDAVRHVAVAHAVPAAVLEAAYQASRHELGTPAAPVAGPPGLGAFLADLAPLARLALATNAPDTGVDRVLSAIGAAEHVTERHFAIGKPAGLAAVVARYLDDGPVLSVGDIWAYDLAAADELGAATALVGPSAGRPDVHPTLRAAGLADLYGDIQTWAAQAAPGPSAPAGVDPLPRKA